MHQLQRPENHVITSYSIHYTKLYDYGLVTPDSGSIVWDGRELQIRSPSHARELGIGMVFQHFSLFETLTVTENIALCLTQTMREQIGDLAGRIRELSGNYGLNIDPDRYVFSLSMGERQRVEIIRCLIQHRITSYNVCYTKLLRAED